jgi:hypothetical protein
MASREEPKFSHSSGAFALKLALPLNPPPSPILSDGGSPLGSPRHALPGGAISRRQSLLSSQVFQTDNDMASELPDAAIAESDEDEHIELGSPFMVQMPESSRASSSSASMHKPWPRSTSLSDPRGPSSSSKDVPAAKDKSFNPLNPMAVSKRPSQMETDDVRPTLASASSMARVPSLLRSKSSPNLGHGFQGDEPATPPSFDTSASFDETSVSFQGLGVMLPTCLGSKDNSPDGALSSPVPKGPQRRVVQRRGSLYVRSVKSCHRPQADGQQPKPKAHLRVQAQLVDEISGVGEIDEMLSEAALHRLNQSRSSLSSPRSRASVFGRFPETAGDDDECGKRPTINMDSPSSSDGEAVEMSSQFDGDEAASVNGVSAIDVEQWRRQREVWLGFREKASPGTGTNNLSRSLGNTSTGGMEVDSPATSSSTRPNKRKWTDSDRFEPYNSLTFKRRAVSPTASLSSALGSPVLSHTNTSFGNNSVAPITIPELGNSQSFFAGLNSHSPSSRGGSPAPRERFATAFANQHAGLMLELQGAGEDEDVSRAGGMMEGIEM